ncbi:UNKNOWN [Stylonychia lemnae]|uniref:Uncharacterized protein n=1 Tax=Stylonychia lemnae TaxID=5949 RepID=A0A078A9F1_STYLE|nr:UNKNOWN [Stylonychia lemnae]|eukprot:CDW78486.1 UNKNOWN [Stylonychia lemnae]
MAENQTYLIVQTEHIRYLTLKRTKKDKTIKDESFFIPAQKEEGLTQEAKGRIQCNTTQLPCQRLKNVTKQLSYLAKIKKSADFVNTHKNIRYYMSYSVKNNKNLISPSLTLQHYNCSYSAKFGETNQLICSIHLMNEDFFINNNIKC